MRPEDIPREPGSIYRALDSICPQCLTEQYPCFVMNRIGEGDIYVGTAVVHSCSQCDFAEFEVPADSVPGEVESRRPPRLRLCGDAARRFFEIIFSDRNPPMFAWTGPVRKPPEAQ